MSSATLLVHAVNHPTVTLFVNAPEYRQRFLDDHPDEDGPLLTVRIDAPEGVSISSASGSNLSEGYRRPDNEFALVVDSESVRASFDWSVVVPDRSHLDSEQVTVTLLDADGSTLDHANLLI
jgi:hypothetical protein